MSRKVFLKHQVNWNTVCGAIRELPWRSIRLSDNPDEVLNEHLSLLVGRYVPTKVIRVRNNDKNQWTRDRSQVNWEVFVSYQVRANETYSE